MKSKILLGIWGYGDQRAFRDSSMEDSFITPAEPRIPPLSSGNIGYFDINPFLLFDEVIIDARCYENIVSSYRRLSFPRIEEEAVNILKYLESIGRLKLVDYDTTLNPFSEFISNQMKIDLKDENITHTSLKESLILWQQFLKNYEKENLPENAIVALQSMDQAIESSIKDINSSNQLPPDLLELLSSYLMDINSTLVLSRNLGVPFYDWSDYIPFYEYKLGRAGIVELEQKLKIQKLERLFQIFIPDFKIRNLSEFERLIEDSRIQDLRTFVIESQLRPESIDLEFLASVQNKVINIELEISNYSRILSYLTMPLGLIPLAGTVIPKIVEEAVMHEITKRKRRSFKWFYFLRDTSKIYSKNDVIGIKKPDDTRTTSISNSTQLAKMRFFLESCSKR